MHAFIPSNLAAVQSMLKDQEINSCKLDNPRLSCQKPTKSSQSLPTPLHSVARSPIIQFKVKVKPNALSIY